ncbi:MAG: aldehyde dehydrogenase family protein, partial [Actinomycetota bacterium]
MERGLELASRIKSGMVHINEATVDDKAHVPFGGIGASGNASGNGHQVRGQGQLGGVHIQPVGHRNR